MGVTQRLAEWVATPTTVSHEATAIVKRSVLDWIGCALLGSRTEAAALATSYASTFSGAQGARIVASGVVTTLGMAAWANGILGHIDDFDDSGIHPSSYLTPTLLALAEARGCSGKAVIEAWAVGYEVTARLVDALRPERAWHTTPLFGTLAATAAASRLLGLDPGQVQTAWGIAASQAGGLMANFGTMTKAMHPGNAARSAVEATELAARGFGAAPDILERLYGYFDCYGAAGSDPRRMVEHLRGAPRLVETKPPVIKAWPTCTGNHRALTGILDLLAQEPLDAAEIVRIEHWGTVPPGTGTLHHPNPQTPLEAKFSLEYNISAAVIDGKVDVSTFSAERFSRGDIQALMSRVVRHQDPVARHHSERTRASLDVDRLRITLADGSVRDIKLGERRVLAGDEVSEKFRMNATSVVSDEAIERIEDHVARLDDLSDVRQLMEWM